MRVLFLVAAVLASGPALAQPPSYVKQVKPLLSKYCAECHNADKARGDLDLTTLATMARGGQNGPSVVPGKPDESLLVRLTENQDSPPMPPKNKPQPTASEKAVLRAWVAGGARDDSGTVTVTLPSLRPDQARPAPIAAVAYAPRGRPLAAGGYGDVTLLEPATGEVTTRLYGQNGPVTAIAFSRDGQALAVASGKSGSAGEVRIYFLPPSGLPSGKPEATIAAHKDVIHALAFSPDGKLLATCGYDRLIRLWDADSGKEVRTLKDHSDAVYAVAFSPDGKLLASGGADRAVKVWDVATGARLYTLGESTDWVYAVAWHPEGKRLAAAGVDRSIRVWEATATGGKVLQSVFAHEGPVLRLAYADDGSTLYSLSEDRTAKAWSTSTMAERRVYAKQPETPLALAVRGDHKQLAVGRYDGALVLIDEATGQVQREPLPVKPKPPVLKSLSPASGPRGRTFVVTATGGGGYGLKGPPGLVGVPHVRSGVPAPGTFELAVTIGPQVAPGVYPVTLVGPGGESAPINFTVDRFGAVPEAEPNDSPTTGQKATLPLTLVGALAKSGETDWLRFEAKAGQQVGLEAVTRAIGSKLEPSLLVADGAGRVLAESTTGWLGFTCPADGGYAVGVRDRDYRGGADFKYRLHIGDVPVVNGVFPLGLPRGAMTEVTLDGVHLGATRTFPVKVPADAAVGSRVPVPVTTPHGPPVGTASVVVGEFPSPPSPAAPIPVPGSADGRIDTPGAAPTYRFTARKGERLLIETHARRLGSPLDSTLEVVDTAGKPVPRATLRSLAKTYTVFRDHDSAGSGIRIEAWTELAMNDYLYCSGELMKIRELPKNPDDDCQFYTAGGTRQGWLDTTPSHHPLGEPLYKVSIHPPGTVFPPNGFPVHTLYFRNDDGGAGYGKDSRVVFDPPADGEYQVRVRDARGQAGPTHTFRLTVRPPRPSFSVSFNPTTPSVWKGGAVPVAVSIDRLDGFDGRVDVRLENLPPGFQAPATNILPSDVSTSLALAADAAAASPPADARPLKLVARAIVNGKEIVREATGGVPKLQDGGDVAATTEQSEVSIRPGGETRLTVRVTRQNDFKGRIPIEVRGLPYGVRVLDIGLNGILITERETVRTFVLYAEPWVEPALHPFVVLAKSERKNSEHAARSVLLKVEGK